MDLKELKNVLNAKGEIIGFSGTFTEEEILQKIAELPIKRAKFVALNFTANPEMPLEIVLKIVKEVEQICSKKSKIVFSVKTHKLLGEKNQGVAFGYRHLKACKKCIGTKIKKG